MLAVQSERSSVTHLQNWNGGSVLAQYKRGRVRIKELLSNNGIIIFTAEPPPTAVSSYCDTP